jgi:LPXTG-site transpeptidase (sortase) family protein
MKQRDPIQIITSFSLVCFVVGILTFGVANVTERFLFGSNTQASGVTRTLGGPALPAPTSEPSEPSTVSSNDEDESESAIQPILPTQFQIPKLDVDAATEHVGYTDDGRMDEPERWEDVAWFQYGYLPGDKGNAVIAGHLDSDTGPAVFAGLYLMEPGDEVTVIGEDGEELTFMVTKVERVEAEEAPLDDIFGPSDTADLNLITCEGHFDPDEEDYDHRLIVYTTLVDS